MALSTYAELKAEIEDHVDEDLADKVDTFIDLAEARHKTEIRIREMLTRSQATLSERFLALPDRFEQMKTVKLLSSETTGPRVLSKPKELTNGQLDEKSRLDDETPCFFTVHEEIEFDRKPLTDLTVEMIYFAQFQPLSDSITTNGLLARAPDCYLYGALVAAAPWLNEDERLDMWAGLYTDARDRINGAYLKSQFAGPVTSRVAGPTP